MEQLRRQLEALLGPSLGDGSPRGSPPPHAEAAPPEAGCVWHFAYGSSMAFATLARHGVRPLCRESAMIVDPSVRMRFRHRGGARRGGRAGRGGAGGLAAAA
jgi:hypothetical protein